MKVYNTLSRQKEEFVPQGDEVRIYVCGITPYDDAHIGHAMSYIIFDVIRRYLGFGGYRLRYVQNITDIDDKIINRANSLGIPASELAKKYTDSFFEDMAALNILPADVYPRATGEIPKIIEVVQGLVDRGYAYEADGSVYFRVRHAADYGKLANRNLESMMAGARIEAEKNKEHPMDFTLWKASKPGEPSWQSPWGEGRPGWHIECSAMSLKYLGDTLDIHGGGQDLIFPHHENEIAQSESFTGKKPFAKYWLHNGLLQFGEEKMSKSLGNLITIKEALKRYSADAIRIFVLSSHYRSPLTYSEEALEAAERGAERLRIAVSRDNPNGGKGEVLDAEPYRKQFIEAMDDDFNTPQALGIIFSLAREINQSADAGINIEKAQNTLISLAREVLGLTLKTKTKMRLETKLFLNLFFSTYEELIDKFSYRLDDYLLRESTQNFKPETFLKLFLITYDQLENKEKKMFNNYLNFYLTSQHDKRFNYVGKNIEEFIVEVYDKYKQDKMRNLRKWDLSNYIKEQSIKHDFRYYELHEFYNELLLSFFVLTYNRLRESKGWRLDDYLETLAGKRFRAETFIKLLILIRNQLRIGRKWQWADTIRNDLEEAGVVVEDSKTGTIWKRKKIKPK